MTKVTQRWLWPVLLLSACRFDPSVNGKSLLDCKLDGDCPRGGQCVDRICVPRPLHIVAVSVQPEVVEAGELCIFHVDAIHSGDPNDISYWWSQTRGPQVKLVGNDSSDVYVTTKRDYAGRYELEAHVSNGRDATVTARVSCTALVSDNAAFVVPGQSGDCSKTRPCGSIEQAGVKKRYYLGVVPSAGTWQVTFFESAPSLDLTGVEIAGGFVYPGWKRDLDQAPTAVGDRDDLNVNWHCDHCILSGMTRYYDLNHEPTAGVDTLMTLFGNDLTLRDSRFLVAGSGNRTSFTFLSVDASSSNVTIEGVDISVAADDFTGTRLLGIGFGGLNGQITDSSVDLVQARHQDKQGLFARMPQSSQLEITNDWVRIGGATGAAEGLVLDCGGIKMSNSIFDLRGGMSTESLAVDLRANRSGGCWSFGHLYSSLFIGGEGAKSTGLQLDSDSDTMTFTNCIIDGGDAAIRTPLRIAWLASDPPPPNPQDFEGSVLILNKGKGPLDAWTRISVETEYDVAQTESLIQCPGCLRTATSAAQFDRANGDFHLTPESSCCLAKGVTVGVGGPSSDRDDVPWADPPSVGPYQYRP